MITKAEKKTAFKSPSANQQIDAKYPQRDSNCAESSRTDSAAKALWLETGQSWSPNYM